MHDTTSPRPVTDETLEQEIQRKGLNAPRVKPEDLENEVKSEHYFTAAQGVIGEATENGDNPFWKEQAAYGQSLLLLTFCVLTLRNGFMVTGESACASPENFDAEVGRKAARANAINKLWPLLGFRLKDKLYEDDIAF